VPFFVVVVVVVVVLALVFIKNKRDSRARARAQSFTGTVHRPNSLDALKLDAVEREREFGF
jgi:hypothetical protein